MYSFKQLNNTVENLNNELKARKASVTADVLSINKAYQVLKEDGFFPAFFGSEKTVTEFLAFAELLGFVTKIKADGEDKKVISVKRFHSAITAVLFGAQRVYFAEILDKGVFTGKYTFAESGIEKTVIAVDELNTLKSIAREYEALMEENRKKAEKKTAKAETV